MARLPRRPTPFVQKRCGAPRNDKKKGGVALRAWGV